jgi:hypothetical protein
MQTWTSAEWVAVITAIFAGLASLVASWRAGNKIDAHDARSTARARERGDTANPAVKAEDRGHL